jgi:hypothetical protein
VNRKRLSARPHELPMASNATTGDVRSKIKKLAEYAPHPQHKLHGADFGIKPSPHPDKSLCDDLRTWRKGEADVLMKRGIELGMVSPLDSRGLPKFIWAVDRNGEVYVAKTKPEQENVYHGYRLGDDQEPLKRYLRDEWNKRCPTL